MDPLAEQKLQAFETRSRKAIDKAEKELRNIEASIQRAITQIKNSSIDTNLKSTMVADLGEIAFEVHHLTPKYREEALQHGAK